MVSLTVDTLQRLLCARACCAPPPHPRSVDKHLRRPSTKSLDHHPFRGRQTSVRKLGMATKNNHTNLRIFYVAIASQNPQYVQR